MSFSGAGGEVFGPAQAVDLQKAYRVCVDARRFKLVEPVDAVTFTRKDFGVLEDHKQAIAKPAAIVRSMYSRRKLIAVVAIGSPRSKPKRCNGTRSASTASWSIVCPKVVTRQQSDRGIVAETTEANACTWARPY